MKTFNTKKGDNDRRPVVSTTYGMTSRTRGMNWNDMRHALSVGLGRAFSASRRFA